MKKLTIIALLAIMAACTTPETVLVNKKTGQVVRCGGSVSGSLTGGIIGYHIQKSNDSDCVADYVSRGFKKD